ncbi:MAG: class I SAM-dependent methyltransferase [Pseudomonadales bacterium]|nr:class I SAM-dependent methyltransferase [Pseudomonadales bacterium]
MADSIVPEYSYNQSGKHYNTGRRTDPRIAARLWQQLDLRQSILNIGAGSGSYEPANCSLVAVEPSAIMLAQRSPGSGPAVQAVAEQLPFADQAFHQVMTVLSMHHWPDQQRAFEEIRRIGRSRFVALSWDPDCEPFWLTRDYFPEIIAMDRKIFPGLQQLQNCFARVEIETLPIPADCEDGFFAAYWKRPEAYLDKRVRDCMSTFARIQNPDKGLKRLAKDLESGAWQQRNSDLMQRQELDAGYRLLIARLDEA